MLIMAGLSIAAQHPPRPSGGLRFYLLDGSPVDSPLAGELGQARARHPSPRQERLGSRAGRRSSARSPPRSSGGRDEDAEALAPIYLLIYDLQRFRDLRKGDDDFGFSSSFGEDKPASPSKPFTTILKDGPPVGVHTLVWCDSLNNLNRTFDRQGLPRVRDPRPLPDERQRLEHPDRLARRRQARREPGPLLQRGREPDREVPPLRPARPEWLEHVTSQFQARPTPEPVAVPSGDGNGEPSPVPASPEEVEPAQEAL